MKYFAPLSIIFVLLVIFSIYAFAGTIQPEPVVSTMSVTLTNKNE